MIVGTLVAPCAALPKKPLHSVGEVSGKKPEHKGASEQQHPQRDERGTEAAPLVVKLLCPPNCYPHPSPSQQPHPEQEAKRGLSLLDSLLVLATFGLFSVGFWQALISRRTAKRQLRAYVSPDDTGFDDPPGTDGKIRAYVWIKNFGETPAADIRHEHQVLVTSTSGFPEAVLPPVVAMPDPSLSALASGQRTRNICVIDSPNDIEQLVEVGKVTIIIRGWIKYRDIFGDKWTTHYCYFRSRQTFKSGMAVTHAPSGNRIE